MRTPYSAQELHQALENILPFDVAIVVDPEVRRSVLASNKV